MNVQYPRYGLILLALLPAWAAAQAFSVPAANSARVEAVYGISVKANAASSVKLSVDSGVLRAAFQLASDSTAGYSANAGLAIPLRFDRKTLALNWSTSLTFEFRNSTPIPDVLRVAYGSTAYPPGAVEADHVYANDWAGKTALDSGKAWKNAEFLIPDFALPSWWIPSVPFPSLDSVFQVATDLKISPRTLYRDSGFQADGERCGKCVTPTMTSVVLEIRKIELKGGEVCAWPNPEGGGGYESSLVIGLPNPALGVQGHPRTSLPEALWNSGRLSIRDPSRWSEADLVSLDGQVVRALSLQSQQSLDLPRGAFRVVLRARDGSSTSFAVVGIR